VEAAKMSAQSISPVMLFGETGTGKELIAQSIHNNSARNQNQYVAINCAAIPENLLEGILFGTSKGAFTGAVDKQGLFEKADGGTLLLDEINSMTVGLQAKLLRFLQERKIRRVGSLDEIDIDLKIISSVNQNPHAAIADGSLRADLFYRLAVVFIRIPPLRERLEDLPLLIPYFLLKTGSLLDKKVAAVSSEVMTLFSQYPWPGNVRELEHVIEGGMNLVNRSHRMMTRHLPTHLSLFFKDRNREAVEKQKPETDQTDTGRPGSFSWSPAWENKPEPGKGILSLFQTRTKSEVHLIKEALVKTSGRPSAAARILGISPQLLNYKIKKYQINRLEYLSQLSDHIK
ncbi:MAG: sigma 54-interacting transcriptional regulator, partial [Proteobacteria bacterium]|nr:sigma 54-interacting transcriptional regulator [Pseudomonadota bacterium]